MNTTFPRKSAAVNTSLSIVVKSEALQRLEAAAHVENIRMGGNIAANIDNASNLLIGESSSSSENLNKIDPVKTQPAEKVEPENINYKDFSYLPLEIFIIERLFSSFSRCKKCIDNKQYFFLATVIK